MALEGVVSKRLNGPYRSGRHDQWVKSKCLREQELVIGGFTRQPKHPDMLGALLTGYCQKADLVFAGKVGTGFSHAEGRKLVALASNSERPRLSARSRHHSGAAPPSWIRHASRT
jgi:bifunctional non-homologous end joining protein LigD